MLIAVGTWTTATARFQNQDGFSRTRINTFELVNSKELPGAIRHVVRRIAYVATGTNLLNLFPAP